MLLYLIKIKSCKGGDKCLSRKNNMYNKRGTSKVVWLIMGGAFFLLVIFPFFGNNLRSLIFTSLYQFRYLGAFCFGLGMTITVCAIFLKPLRKSKVIILGIILVLIGYALGAPNLLISLFTGSGGTRGYHFFG